MVRIGRPPRVSVSRRVWRAVDITARHATCILPAAAALIAIAAR